MPPLAAALIGAAAMRVRLQRTALGKAAGGDAASSGTQAHALPLHRRSQWRGFDDAARRRGLCEMSSAPLRGEFLRWVPDSLPLRFAALQASGKARLKVWAQLSPLLSRAHAAKAECEPGPSARLAAKRRRISS